MRTGPKLPAGRLALFALEGLHLFDGEPVWKIFFQTVKIIAGSERRSLPFMVGADWLKRYTDSGERTIDSDMYFCAVSLSFDTRNCKLRLYGLSKRLQLNGLHDGEVTSSPPDYF